MCGKIRSHTGYRCVVKANSPKGQDVESSVIVLLNTWCKDFALMIVLAAS